MCLVAPGLVTEVDAGVAVVAIDGRTRRALTLLTPEVRPGDWVLVGAGAVIRRLDPDMARATDAQVREAACAIAETPTTSSPTSGSPARVRPTSGSPTQGP